MCWFHQKNVISPLHALPRERLYFSDLEMYVCLAKAPLHRKCRPGRPLAPLVSATADACSTALLCRTSHSKSRVLNRSLFEVIINTNVPTMLEDLSLHMSMFAPIDFSQMRKSDVGLSLLDNRLYASRLRNVSDRQSLYSWQPFDAMVLAHLYGWRRGSVVKTSVFNWRTFPDLRLIYD